MWNLFKRTPKREPRTEKISEDTEVTFIPRGDGECVLPVIHPAGMVFPANPPKPCPHGVRIVRLRNMIAPKNGVDSILRRHNHGSRY